MLKKLNELCAILKNHNFESEVFETGRDAAMKVVSLTKCKTVGFGNSMTIKSLNLIELLKPEAKNLYLHLPGNAGEDERNALRADIYLTSANAVSMRSANHQNASVL